GIRDDLVTGVQTCALPILARLGVSINMHPTAPLNMHGLDQRPLIPGMAFLLDTSMATVRLIMSGLFEEAPGLQLIVPHTGGFVPDRKSVVEGREGDLREWR